MSSTTNVVREPGSLPNPKLPAGTDTLAQIEHIVVPMIENHSYDDHLGMLRRSNGCKLVRNGLALDANPYTQGKLLKAFQMPWTCQLRGTPSQAWDASPAAYDNGRDDGFVTGSGPAAMGYWDSTDIACYCGLAQTFRVADRWFCSVVAHTHPNRRFLIAGTAAGIVSTSTASLLAPTGAVVPPSEPCTRCVGVS
jgi:phospholipase C